MDNFDLKKLQQEGYIISTDQQLIDFDAVYNFLAHQSYWAKGMPAEKLQKAIANSLCFGVYQYESQTGFARVITDRATFAYVCDVFILEDHRGKGLSKWLIKTIRDHPALQGLRRWSLATADAHGLYKQFGFSPLRNTDRWMEIFSPHEAQ